MNYRQKKIIPLILGLFLISVIYVPEIFIYSGIPLSGSWTFIWDVTFGVDLKTLFTEWVFISILAGGLFFYYK